MAWPGKSSKPEASTGASQSLSPGPAFPRPHRPPLPVLHVLRPNLSVPALPPTLPQNSLHHFLEVRLGFPRREGHKLILIRQHPQRPGAHFVGFLFPRRFAIEAALLRIGGSFNAVFAGGIVACRVLVFRFRIARAVFSLIGFFGT